MIRVIKNVVLGLVAAVLLFTACGGNSVNIRRNDNCSYKSYPGFNAYIWVFDDIDVKEMGWGNSYHFTSSGPYLYSMITKKQDGYYIAPFGGEYDLDAVVVHYEDAPKMIAWLNAAVDKIDEVEQQMEELDIEQVSAEIDLPMDFPLFGSYMCGLPVLYDNPEIHFEKVESVAAHINVSPEAHYIIIKVEYGGLREMEIYVMDEARDFYVSVLRPEIGPFSWPREELG